MLEAFWIVKGVQTPEHIVEALLEQSGRASRVFEEDDDLRADVEQTPDRPVARWPFTATELLDPSGTAQTDWLMANATHPDDPDNLIAVQIQRNLNPENKARGMDIDYDSIFDPYNGDEIIWRDVFVKPDGSFDGFADDLT